MLRGCGSPRLRQAATVGAVAVVLLVGLAVPALAHGRGSDATNYASRIIDAPAVPGVTWRIHGGDELLEVVNRSGAEVVVHGYRGEPYLRVGPDGVFENRRSPATYLNDERYGQVPVPPQADPDADPDWVRVSHRTRHAWHDHRIHWMSPRLPPSVAAADGAATTVDEISPWEVPFTHDGRDHSLVGELRWVPGPSPWPWVAVGTALALPALAGLRTTPDPPAQPGGPPSSWPGLARPAAVVLGMAAAANATNLVDDLFAVPLPWSTAAFAAAQTAIFVSVGLFGAVRGWQGREGAFTALGVGSAALLIGQGLLYLPALAASQLATVFPAAVPRTVVAVSLAQALPVGVAAILGTRRLLPATDAAGDDEAAPVPS